MFGVPLSYYRIYNQFKLDFSYQNIYVSWKFFRGVQINKLCFEMKMTIVISKILLVKSSDTNFIFCILLDYVPHESFKEFLKNSHYENMRACFLRRCQNSLWQTSPEMMHFQAWKKNILTDIMSLLLIQLGFRHTKYLKITF